MGFPVANTPPYQLVWQDWTRKMETTNTGIIPTSYQQQIKSVDFVFKALNKQVTDLINAEVHDLNNIPSVLTYIKKQIQRFLKLQKQYQEFTVDIVEIDKAKQGYCDFLLSKQLIDHVKNINKGSEFVTSIKQVEKLLEENQWFFKMLKEYIAKTTRSSFQSNIESRFNSLLNGGIPIIEKSKLIESMSHSLSEPMRPTNVYPSPSATLYPRVSSIMTEPCTPTKPRSISPSSGAVTNNFLDIYSRKGFIDIQTFLNMYYELDSDILLIDFRSSYSFKKDHISLFKNIINIEPVSVKSNYTIQDLYTSSLLLASTNEKQLFQKISAYQLVIIFDESTSNSNPSYWINMLTEILYDRNVNPGFKPKRRPVFLNGGYAEFTNFMNNQPKEPIPEQRLFPNILRYSNYTHKKTEALPRSPSPSHLNNSAAFNHVNRAYASPEQTYSTLNNASESSFFTTKNSNRLKKEAGVFRPLTSSPASLLQPLSPKPPTIKVISPILTSASSSATNWNTRDDKGYYLKPNILPNSNDIPSRSNSPTRSRIIVSGLFNLGNSCYLNSVMQCIIGTKELTNYLLEENYQQFVAKDSNLGSKGMLTNEYHSLALKMLKNSKVRLATTPKQFKKVVGEVNASFNNCLQQDAAEFLHFLLDTIHEDLNWSANKGALPNISAEDEANREILPLRLASTIEWERYLKTDYSSIIEIFAGQYASRLECGNCHKTSTTYIPFNMLSVPIPNKVQNLKLTDCIDQFVFPEILTGDNVWKCTACNASKMTKKQLTITRLPRILAIHLERFTVSRNYEYVKNNCKIEIPLNLDMNKYWPKIQDSTELEQLKKFPNRNQSGDWKYKLYGVVRHYGTLNSGHYISEVLKCNKWLKFDDDKVGVGNLGQKLESDGSAYILFYERII